MKKTVCLLMLVINLLITCAVADEVIKLDSEPTMYIVGSRDNYNLVDANGAVIEENWAQEVKEADSVLVVRRIGLYGIMNTRGEWLAEPRFSDIGSFSEGMAAVSMDGKYGYIDSNGCLIVPCEYEDAEDFCCGFAAVQEDGKWGYVNADGELAIEPRFDEAEKFDEDGHAYVFVDDCVGVIDASGSWLCEPQYRREAIRENYCIVYYKDGSLLRYGYLFSDGTLIEPRYTEYGYPSENLICVRMENGLWGYIDRQGNMVIEPRFEWANNFENGYAVVCEDSHRGIIDKSGAYFCRPKYDSIWQLYGKSGGYILVLDDCETVLREDGTMWDACFEHIYQLNDTFFAVETNGLYGLADWNGEVVLKPQYKEVYYAGDGFAVVTNEEVDANAWIGGGIAGNSVIVSFDGNPLSEEIFDNVYLCDDGTVIVEKDNEKRTFRIENGVMSEIRVDQSTLDLNDYAPFTGEKNAAGTIREDIGFDTGYDLPRLDGATALFPLYAAYAQTVYPEDTRYKPYERTDITDSWAVPKSGEVTCSKTDMAYERLLRGTTDIIFCAEPSEEQLNMAAARGVQMELTPIGYEAFVFIVPEDSPVVSLRSEDIISIYSGTVKRWEELGIHGNGEIIAYQRPRNSGSQTALQAVMGDTPIMRAPGYVVDDMTGIVEKLEYRSLPGAIGYSFRFFVSDMLQSNVKMIEIDGVAPTEENIRNCEYPFISTLYAVTRKGETNPNVQTLLHWLTGETAQTLLEESGYVGLN